MANMTILEDALSSGKKSPSTTPVLRKENSMETDTKAKVPTGDSLVEVIAGVKVLETMNDGLQRMQI